MHTSEGLRLGDDSAIRSSVSKYYGETLQGSSDLKTSACCTAKSPPAEIRHILKQLPEEITSRYYGCGSPFPVGLQGSGLRVLDLGCGTGRDCYVCAALVGEKGFVTGVDMTDAQLAFANKHSSAWQQHLGYAQPNMRFVKGAIEQLQAAGVEAGSIDVIISNCVINLSPDKPAVLREAYRALTQGGEMYFSDVYCDRRLPAAIRKHEVLLGECLGGALAINDFARLCKEVGFTDPRVLEASPIEVHDPQLRELLGDAAFYSATFRLFKLPGQLEPPPQEDYGQTVTYSGSMPGAPQAYTLDSDHTFPAGVPVRVSGNTAAMLSASWLAPHFAFTGSKAQHLGQFRLSSSSSSSGLVDGVYVAALAAGSAAAAAGGCCPAKGLAVQQQQQQQQQNGGCCPSVGAVPAAAAAPTAAAGAGAGAVIVSCGATSNAGCCPPVPKQNGSCCPPVQQQLQQASGCCPSKEQQVNSSSIGSSSCCPPKTQTQPGCCPAPVAVAAVGAGNGCGSNSSNQNGCCPPQQAAGCCPAPAAVAPAAGVAAGGCKSNSSNQGCCPAPSAAATAAAPDGCCPAPKASQGGCGSNGRCC